MPTKRELKLIAFSAVFLLFIAGCGSGDVATGAPTTPFLGGTQGLEISFLEGSPPAEVTDGGTFPFQVVLKFKNNGEFDLKKRDVNVSLIGFLAKDFNVNSKDVEGKGPDDDPLARKKDSEGNIIESVETFVTFPSNTEYFDFKGKLAGNNVFVFRADVCYKYKTLAVSDICVLENLVDPADNAICNPSESKPIFSSASPLQITSFRQNVAGKDKIQFSFDIVHSGTGDIFKGDASTPYPDCPKTPTGRRTNEDTVNVIVQTDIGSDSAKLNCVGLTTLQSEG